MDFNLKRILHEMDWMAIGVTGALLLMGVVSLAVFFERLVTYARSRAQSRRFAALAGTLVKDGALRSLRDKVTDYKASHLARMLAPALDTYLAAGGDGKGQPSAAVVELVRREIARQHEDASLDLRRGLTTLASVGSLSPFVGLLGTVVGIIAAFGKISTTGSAGLSSVAGGISEALVVTAFGLVIAIPSVMLFNILSGRADRIHHGLGLAAGQFIDHLEFRGAIDVGNGSAPKDKEHREAPVKSSDKTREGVKAAAVAS